MRKPKSLMTRIGDAVEAAKDKTQDVGISLMRKVEVAAASVSREAGKTRTAVKRKTRAATASVNGMKNPRRRHAGIIRTVGVRFDD